MTNFEKQKQTIIEKYGSWEAYVELRYRNPLKASQRRKIAQKGGRANNGKPRGFTDPETARRAAFKRWGK